MKDQTFHLMGWLSTTTLVLVVLKFCDVIDWNWWWVVSPIWISFGGVSALFLFYMLIGVIVSMIDMNRRAYLKRKSAVKSKDIPLLSSEETKGYEEDIERHRQPPL